MTSTSSRPLAADAFERLIENRIMICEDLYDLDGETFLRNRGGRIETGNIALIEQEVV